VIGSAIAFQLLFGLELWVGCVITGIDTFTFFLMEYAGEGKLQMLFCSLITLMCATFCVDVGISKPEASNVVEGTLVPQVSSYAVVQAVGIIGAVIMPHNIYLHSGLVNADEERKINRNDKDDVREANKYNAIESSIALFVSFIINMMVVCSFAAAFYSLSCAEQSQGGMACIPLNTVGKGEDMYPTLNSSAPSGRWFDAYGKQWKGAPHDLTGYKHDFCHTHDNANEDPGRVHPWVCSNIGLQNAGESLKDSFPGTGAEIMWGVGLLAAGQMSTVTGTRAGQYVMEGFVKIKIPKWKRVAVTRSIALVPSVAFALMAADNPTIADTMNQWLNILQSVQLPFALIPVLHFTSRAHVMGPFKNSGFLQAVCWSLALGVIMVNFYLIYQTLAGMDSVGPVLIAIVAVVGSAYVCFLGIIIGEDAKRFCGMINRWMKNEEEPLGLSPTVGAQTILTHED